MQQQFTEDLILAFCCMDLLAQLVGVLVQLAVLRALEHGLPTVVVDWL